MLDLATILRSQKKYGISVVNIESESVSYEIYLQACRTVLTDRTPTDYYGWDSKRQNDFTDNIIVNFVRNNIRLVDGFVDMNGDIKQDDLIDRLRIDIVDFGILREALEDDTIQEIQINDAKTIWVVRSGRTELFVDSNGKPFQFVSNDELHATIDRLIYNSNGTAPRMTSTNPLINTRTAGKGYRLSGVDHSAITPDSKIGFDFLCTSITIRKPSPSMLTFDDFEEFGTLVREMSDFLRYCGRANICLVCVGATSSGKTTLLNAVVWEVDPALRVILIQNPTEIMIYDRSEETGANSRNVLHWEAQDLSPEAAENPTTPTMANMISHILRNTPDVAVPGEVRSPEEFMQVSRIFKTGHRALSTWHASDGPDAIDRAGTEVATLGGSALEHAQSFANSIDIIVSQAKLGDGSRKVMSIEEVTGRMIEGRAETIKLFEFKFTGEADIDPVTGRVEKVHGYFQQSNPISSKLLDSFYSVGLSKEELAPFRVCPEIIEGRSNIPSVVRKEEERLKKHESIQDSNSSSSPLDNMTFLNTNT